MENTENTYQPPTIEKVGTLQEITKASNQPSADVAKSKVNNAFPLAS
jgi:hypothetical protein